MLTTIVTGTRPNLIKAAPLIREFEKQGLEYNFVHTGQHWNDEMFINIVSDLSMPIPYLLPHCSDQRPVKRLSSLIHYFSDHCEKYEPSLILTFGDVDSSLAVALAANKLGIPLGHIEAGERCGNRKMPEEMNRILIDEMADFHFCASTHALRRIDNSRLSALVGNLMIDQLRYTLEKNEDVAISSEPYGLLTLHRQENVDNAEKLNGILEIIDWASPIRVIFPIHPRTNKVLNGGVSTKFSKIRGYDPLEYSTFIHTINNAEFVITDSGGIQNEASYLNIPTITWRNQTEWPDTVYYGSNFIFTEGMEMQGFKNLISDILNGKWKQSKFKDMPEYKMNASENIVKLIKGLQL